MRLKGATSNRPEQLLLAEILRYHTYGNVSTEVKLKGLKSVDALDFTADRSPRIDIVLQFDINGKYLIRVNGPYHDTDKQRKKDRAQKLFLEMQYEQYTVIDVSYVRHELLFERNKRKLEKIELYQVVDLLHAQFLIYGITFNRAKTSEWIQNSQHLA